MGAVAVEGPKGKPSWSLPREIKASVKDNRVSLVRDAETRSVKALHGLSRSLVHNMVHGVSEGFSKSLEIEGVGFKAAVQGSTLNLALGKSHPILFPIPKEIKIVVTENTKLTINGIDKKLVGQVAADIRRYYPPEPYKGKGGALRGRSGAAQGRQNRSIVMALRDRKIIRHRIHTRIRKRVNGTAERPRLAVHFSGKHVYAQVIDDDAGKTLVSAATTEEKIGGKKAGANRASAEKVGKAIAERLLSKKVENVVFDRGGFLYHGKVKALADAAREGGLKF